MKTFFTSDTHFFHKNILKYNPKTRPWANVEEMNEALVEAWNSTVSKGDVVYHLGDFSFGRPEETEKILERLNGTIRLVRGNHDPMHGHGYTALRKRCEWIRDYYEMRHGDARLVLMHFPLAVWNRNHHGAIMLHGHSHGSYQGQGRIADIGWDAEFKIVHIDDIVQRMLAKPIVVLDHHEARPGE